MITQTHSPLQSQIVADALAVVSDPTPGATMATRRIYAWAALKTARGQTISQTRLQRLLRAQVVADAHASVIRGAA